MLNNNLIKDNKSKSILSELKELARKTKRSNSQKVYAQYFLERFLYRLANSKYKNNFILRGSTLLYMLEAVYQMIKKMSLMYLKKYLRYLVMTTVLFSIQIQ